MSHLLRQCLLVAVSVATLCTASPLWANLKAKQFAAQRYHGKAPKRERDYRELQAMGIHTVVETRKFYKRKIARERDKVLAHGMNYIFAPMGFHPLNDGNTEFALRAVANDCLTPLYIHCNLGLDRAGLVIALYRVRFLGWDPSTAFSTFKAQQFNPRLKGLDEYFWTQTYK